MRTPLFLLMIPRRALRAARRLRPGSVAATGLAGVLALVAALGAPLPAQAASCTSLPHVCDASKSLSKAIKKAGKKLEKCAAAGTSPCDLSTELAGISSGACRDAVDCRLNDLLATAGGAVSGCSEQLFGESRGLFRDIAKRIDKDKRSLIPADLAACESAAGSMCGDPVSPALSGACAGATTPSSAASCVCAEAGVLVDDILLTPQTCRISPAPPPPWPSPPPAPKAGLPLEADALSSAAAKASSKPNIVMILSDDQRWDTIGTAHSIDGVTPVMPHLLAELAASGTSFTNAFHSNPLCAPSRASLLTGLYSHNHRVIDNFTPTGGATFFDDTNTLAGRLHDAGYRTGMIGKYLNEYSALLPCIPPGWDDWEAFDSPSYYDYSMTVNGSSVPYGSAAADYSTDVVFGRAVSFIQSGGGGNPFFLLVAPYGPHGPAPPAPRHAGLFAGIPDWRPPSYAEPNASDKPAWIQAITWTPAMQNSTDTLVPNMLESLQSVDEGVLAVMDALRSAGLAGNTVVIYAGDNGFAWGEHRWAAKSCPYEECVRMPLIIRDPSTGLTPRVAGQFVQIPDLTATIREIAGLAADPAANGTSLKPILNGNPGSWRTEVLSEHWYGGVPDFALVRDNQWKYIEYSTGETELYDLQTDPFELVNVASDPGNASLIATLAGKLHALQAQ